MHKNTNKFEYTFQDCEYVTKFKCSLNRYIKTIHLKKKNKNK